MADPLVSQVIDALAVIESADNPHAWGDGGRALGRWQVHPDRLWFEAAIYKLTPTLGETWDGFVGRVLRAMVTDALVGRVPVAVAMYWHLGHWCATTAPEWDWGYAAKFDAALTAGSSA